jgi:hypothetical protein
MSSDLSLSLTLRQRDELSRPMARTLQGVTRETQEATRSVNAVGDASAHVSAWRLRDAERFERAAIAAEHAVARETNRALDERLRGQQEFHDALRELGVRSEQEIQREIGRTQAAYRTLAEAGTLSAEEQSRAFDAMRSKVAELNSEMGRLSRTQRGMRFAQRGAGMAIGAGEMALAGVAAAHVVAGPMDRAMSYDRQIALMANTAFNEDGAAGRIRGMAQLRDVVKKTIAAGGGTPEDVTAAMTQMLGQNAVSHDTVFRLMPLLQRYATGTGSDTTELGDVAMRSIQTFGIKENQIQDVLDASIKGGHMGGFHLRQMAKWLPQQMASAKNSGMSGMDGIASLIALNEVSMTTAGNADEAGNNVLDLLQHLNSQDTTRKIKKELGETVSVRYADALQHGQGPLEAFAGMINQVMAKDKNYQTISQKLATTKDDGEKRELYERMQQVIAGSAIGKIIHNRQEMLAMMGYLNNRDRYNQIKAGVLNAKGFGETDAQVMESTDSFKTERAKSLSELGESDALRGFDGVVGKAADKLTEYSQQYPGLISSIMGAKLAFEGVTGALAAFGLVRMVTGHGAGAREAGHAGASALSSLVRKGGRAVGWGSRFLRRGGSVALAALTGGIEAWQVGHDESLTPQQRNVQYSAIAGHTAGAGLGGWGGAVAGAAIGTAIFPGVGTAIGGAIGGLGGGFLGDLLGDKLGKTIGDAIFHAESQKQSTAQPAPLNVTVNLDGQQLYQSLQQINMQEARRR